MHAPESAIPRHLAQAVLTIDLDAIASNWRLLQHKSEPAQCAAVIKADAYGCGLAGAAPALARAGCKTFFVAHASEALELRRLLREPAIRIYTLNGLAGGAAAVRAMIEADVRPVIGSFEDLALWRESANGEPTAVALQFSTGMNRLGFSLTTTGEVSAMLAGRQDIALDFVMSHFVASEEAVAAINDRQIADFSAIRAHFPGIAASMANSSGIFLPQAPHYDLVRPGYALYGGNPCPGLPNPMQPVVRLQAPILQLRDAQPGETAGYNGIWCASRLSKLAIIGVGYADGLLRSASGQDNPAQVLVGGHPCPVAGRVSMDLVILDVTEAPASAVRTGEMAEILGTETSVDALAAHCGTIGYEILTSLGRRYYRQYASLT
jgi:alanine racemase